MNLTDYHAKYFAYELTKRCPSDSVEKLAGAVAGAQVDLNPHQIDAALFAFRSPLSRGAILADEVGLGKTMRPGSCSRNAGPNGAAARWSSPLPICASNGKDDYSLAVQSLPEALPEPGQQELEL